MLQVASIISLDNIKDSWVLDSMASFHATTHNFLDCVQGDFGQVYLGDDKSCKLVGKRKHTDKITK